MFLLYSLLLPDIARFYVVSSELTVLFLTPQNQKIKERVFEAWQKSPENPMNQE